MKLFILTCLLTIPLLLIGCKVKDKVLEHCVADKSSGKVTCTYRGLTYKLKYCTADKSKETVTCTYKGKEITVPYR